MTNGTLSTLGRRLLQVLGVSLVAVLPWSAAQAGGASWSVGIGVAPNVYIGASHGGYHGGYGGYGGVYVAPPSGYYYAPPPVYYAPPPVYRPVHPHGHGYGYGRGNGHGRGHHGWDGGGHHRSPHDRGRHGGGRYH